MSKLHVFLDWGWPGAMIAAVLVLSSAFAVEPAQAASESSGKSKSILDQEFQFALGGFFPYIESDFSLGPSSGGSGGTIDLQNDLGLSNHSASPWVSFNWKFLPRHNLHVEWFRLNQDGSKTADTTFTIGDTAVGLGAQLETHMDIDLGRITYGYSVYRTEKWDATVQAGLHVVTAKLTATASGAIMVNGMPVASGTSTESTSALTFPLPHLGAGFRYAFTPKLVGSVDLLGFYIELGDYSGSLIEVDGLVSYNFTDEFALGGGLKYFRVDLDANNANGNAEFQYQFFGPAIFGMVTF